MGFLFGFYLVGCFVCFVLEKLLGKLNDQEYTTKYLLSSCWISWFGVVRQMEEFDIVCKQIREEKEKD